MTHQASFDVRMDAYQEWQDSQNAVIRQCCNVLLTKFADDPDIQPLKAAIQESERQLERCRRKFGL